MRPEEMSPMIRKLHYYDIPEAGAQIGLKRSKSYDAASAGLIPIERHGKLHLVPRERWDRKVKRLLLRGS